MVLESPGSALARIRWAKPDADRDQPREAGKLGGRPRSDAPRCACGAYTAKLAAIRKHECEKETK